MAIPDRLSAFPGPHFHKDHPPVRITVDGVEYTGRVVEFCVSKGWVRHLVLDDDGDPIMASDGKSCRIKWKHGRVAVWLLDAEPPAHALTPMVKQ